MAYKTLKLARLAPNWEKQPQLFERYWDETMRRIEGSVNNLQEIQQQLADQLAQILEAQATADAAQIAADTAQVTAEAAQSQAFDEAQNNSLVFSYVVRGTDPIISAAADGTVTIGDHTRVYGNSDLNPTVAVNGGIISTGLSAGKVVRVYYLDPIKAGGSVTYQYTVDPDPPKAQGFNVHLVGAVVIPSTGTSPGGGTNPPGTGNPIP